MDVVLYYETAGKQALERQVPDLVPRLAIGLAGEGSECFGFDDELSRDHDWGPAFCIWMTEQDYVKHGVQVQAVYRSLLDAVAGFSVRKSGVMSGGRVGCLCIDDWYRRYTGYAHGPETLAQWRQIPESFLATATNGEIFADPLGVFMSIRQKLLAYYPEDIRIKKIVARAATMAQAGQYNYPRCVRRGDTVAAQLAIAEFTRAAMSMVYLLNRSYAPYYKWTHRGMKNLEKLPRVAVQLEKLSRGEGEAQEIIEGICLNVSAELRRQQLTTREDTFLIDLCADMMQRIQDPKLRQTHIMQE